MAAALRKLGYQVTGPNGTRDPDIERTALPMAKDLVGRFDAFQDNPWPMLYRDMDRLHPGSKFILTVREPEAWIASMVKYFGADETPMRKWIYGVGAPKGNETACLDRYLGHNAEVVGYFADRPGDLLVMDLADGHGWRELCGFLGTQIPNAAFPHANRGRTGADRPVPAARAP